MTSDKNLHRARRRFTERLAMTILFTVVQGWATMATLVLLQADGVLAVASALVLSAGLIAVYDAWRDVWASSRDLKQDDDAEIPGLVKL